MLSARALYSGPPLAAERQIVACRRGTTAVRRCAAVNRLLEFPVSHMKGPPSMQRYLSYWRRGWWAWLLAACFNLTALPITWAWEPIASEHPIAFVIGAFLSWSVVVAPFWGWLFETFAANSRRIVV